MFTYYVTLASVLKTKLCRLWEVIHLLYYYYCYCSYFSHSSTCVFWLRGVCSFASDAAATFVRQKSREDDLPIIICMFVGRKRIEWELGYENNKNKHQRNCFYDLTGLMCMQLTIRIVIIFWHENLERRNLIATKRSQKFTMRRTWIFEWLKNLMIVCLLLQTDEWLSTDDLYCLPWHLWEFSESNYVDANPLNELSRSSRVKLPHLQNNAARITDNVAQM